MFSMLHSKLIKREEIAVIFTTLSEEYEMLGGNKQIDIYIVGGAAILLDFDYRMSTIDIDAYYKDDSILQKSINAVAKKLNLPSDWLNHDFVSTPSFSSNITKLSAETKMYGKYIKIHSMAPKYLIAMKLKSSRPTGGDLDDIVMMIYELRYKNVPITYEEIITAYKELYPDFSNTYDYFLEKAKEAFETPIEDFSHLFNKSSI